MLECTGKFNDRDKAAVHLTRGADASSCRPRRNANRPWSMA